MIGDHLKIKNKKLLKALVEKEELYLKICDRVLRCPYCGGKYVYEGGCYEEGYEGFWCCFSSPKGNEHYPTKGRLKLIEKFINVDEYWDYDLWETFTYYDYEFGDFAYKKFNKRKWEKEHKLKWMIM